MPHHIQTALEAALAEAPRRANLRAVLAAFHDAEAAAFGPDVFRDPFECWRGRLDTVLTARFMAHFDGFGEDGDLGADIMRQGLAMRFGLVGALPAGFGARLAQHGLAGLRIELVFEACAILHAGKDWPALCDIASGAQIRKPQHERYHALFGDWAVLAAYRQMLPAFSRNALDGAMIDGFDNFVETIRCRAPAGSRNRKIYQAVQACMRGKPLPALQSLLGAKVAKGTILGYFEQLEAFVGLMKLTAPPDPEYNAALDTLCIQYRHLAGGTPALLVSVDSAGFDRHIDLLAESFGYWNPDGILHLHCVGFEPDAGRIEALEAEHFIRINHTVDRNRVSPDNPALFRGYCAGARYMYLPDYLKTYKRVVVADMGGAICRPLDTLWIRDDDEILIASKLLDPDWRGGRLLWEAVDAGTFAIPISPENVRFAQTVANYLHRQMQACAARGGAFSGTDRVALVLALLRFRTICMFAPCGDLLRQAGDWRAGNDAAKAGFQNEADHRLKAAKRRKGR